jgi:hypothetical protein
MPYVGFEPTIPASEDSACLRPRGQCDWHIYEYHSHFTRLIIVQANMATLNIWRLASIFSAVFSEEKTGKLLV